MRHLGPQLHLEQRTQLAGSVRRLARACDTVTIERTQTPDQPLAPITGLGD
jgi:hypothetical protein